MGDEVDMKCDVVAVSAISLAVAGNTTWDGIRA